MVDGKLKFTVTKYFNGYPSYDKSTPFEHSALDNDWHMITLTSDYPKTSDATIASKLYIDGEYVGVATEYCNPLAREIPVRLITGMVLNSNLAVR